MKFDMEKALSTTSAETENCHEVTGIYYEDGLSDYPVIGFINGVEHRWDENGYPRDAETGPLVKD